MTDPYRIEIRLIGDTLTPANIRSRDIATIIEAIEQMLAAVIARDNPHLGVDESEVTVGLAEVLHGSYRMQFQSQYDPEAKRAFVTITTAIHEQQFDALPQITVEAIKSVRKIARLYHTDLQLGYQNGTFESLATISANTAIDVAIPQAESETTLYGHLLRIGGTNPPTAQLQLLNGQRLNCNVTESDNLSVAKQLGARLYTQVGVRGMARWDLRDMALIFFRIDEVLPYRGVPLGTALAQLRDEVGDIYANIPDLEAYFADIRDDEEGSTTWMSSV